MYHYTYRLDLIESGEFYFGSRSCENHPTLDCYMGSMKSWKVDKVKLIKTILDISFCTREACVLSERDLILHNINNPLNRNYHIPGVGFHTLGLVQVRDAFGKVFRLNKEDELIKSGTLVPFWEGRKHTEEAKIKQSESAKVRKITETNENKRRQGISEGNKGKAKSKEFKDNLVKIRLGSSNPMFGKTGSQHHNSKPAHQYTKCGDFIKTWPNAKTAANELNLNYNCINNCLRGVSKTYRGFIWKYVKND